MLLQRLQTDLVLNIYGKLFNKALLSNVINKLITTSIDIVYHARIQRLFVVWPAPLQYNALGFSICFQKSIKLLRKSINIML